MRFKKQNQGGFTIIELLVVIGITIVAATAGILYLANYRSGHDLNLALESIVAVIRDSQNRAITQQNGKQWGVRFNNNSVDRYEIFSGPSYASGTVDNSYNFRQGIIFSEPSSGNVFDAIFEPLTGRLNQHKIISLITGQQDDLVGNIIINTSGLITVRVEKKLAGYWHLDEGEGNNIYDASGNNKTGIITAGGGGWTSGKIDKAYNFDGSATFISIGSSTITGTSPFTLSAWLKLRTHSSYGLAVYMGNASQSQSAWIGYTATAQVGASNSIGGGFYGRNYGSGIADNEWHLVTLTFSGGANGTAVLYVDGIQKTTDVYTPNLQPTSLIMGKANTGTPYWYNGLIDDVRIYKRALTATEVLQLYNDLK